MKEQVGGQEQHSEKWDNFQRTLTVETIIPLERRLREVSADIKAGKIKVAGTDVKSPQLTTRLIIYENSEEKARRRLADERLDVHNSAERVEIIDNSRNTSFEIGNNSFVSISIGGVTMVRGGNVSSHGIRKEVEMLVPNQSIQYDLRAASGTIAMENTRGNSSIHGASADVRISNHEGDLDVDTASGDIALNGFKGKLELDAASGDLKATHFDGEINAKVTSGDIDIRGAFHGNSRLKSISGDIDISIVNKSLGVSASVLSGDIEVNGVFNVSRQRRNNIEGYLGDNPHPVDRLGLETMSGDITFS